MEVIIGLIIGFVLLAFLYGVLCVIIRKWPALIWIIGVGGGITVGLLSAWWIGLIIGFIVIGILAHAESSDGHRCAHCGSYDTDVTKTDARFEYWKCNKCGNITYG